MRHITPQGIQPNVDQATRHPFHIPSYAPDLPLSAKRVGQQQPLHVDARCAARAE